MLPGRCFKSRNSCDRRCGGACFNNRHLGAIYETKAGCRRFRSCNTGACSRGTEWSAASRTEANKADAQKIVQIITSDKVAQTNLFAQLAPHDTPACSRSADFMKPCC